jgi:hypothetical protein
MGDSAQVIIKVYERVAEVEKGTESSAVDVLNVFGGHVNHLGAGAFEITPRRLPFERVAAAMSKTIFDMHGVFHGGCKALIAHRIC